MGPDQPYHVTFTLIKAALLEGPGKDIGRRITRYHLLVLSYIRTTALCKQEGELDGNGAIVWKRWVVDLTLLTKLHWYHDLPPHTFLFRTSISALPFIYHNYIAPHLPQRSGTAAHPPSNSLTVYQFDHHVKPLHVQNCSPANTNLLSNLLWLILLELPLKNYFLSVFCRFSLDLGAFTISVRLLRGLNNSTFLFLVLSLFYPFSCCLNFVAFSFKD